MFINAFVRKLPEYLQEEMLTCLQYQREIVEEEQAMKQAELSNQEGAGQ